MSKILITRQGDQIDANFLAREDVGKIQCLMGNRASFRRLNAERRILSIQRINERGYVPQLVLRYFRLHHWQGPEVCPPQH